MHVFAGTEAAGTPQQTLTTTRTAGGLFVVAPDPPLAPGAYVATAEQADASGNLGRSAAVGFTVSTIVRIAVTATATATASPTSPTTARR